jgi:hypothetical protein
LRPSAISFFSQMATLFSAWQATTQAPHPVHRSRSTTIPHLYGLVSFSILGNPLCSQLTQQIRPKKDISAEEMLYPQISQMAAHLKNTQFMFFSA